MESEDQGSKGVVDSSESIEWSEHPNLYISSFIPHERLV